MKFSELVEQALTLLQRQGRISYRALKREFELDDELLADLKEELLFTHAEQVKEEGPGLVWVQEQGARSTEHGTEGEKGKWGNGETAKDEKTKDAEHRTLNTELPAAERRQLTV